jgi:hypothetical protein
MFILAMITVFVSGSPMIQTVGTFEHYGQCLQAEAAMSENVTTNANLYQIYRCLPLRSEDAQKETHS